MNKENAAQYIPLVKALSEGKTIDGGKTWHPCGVEEAV